MLILILIILNYYYYFELLQFIKLSLNKLIPQTKYVNTDAWFKSKKNKGLHNFKQFIMVAGHS